MYDYAKCDEQLRSCLTTPLKFELHFTHISRTVGSLKVRTQGWKRVVEGSKGVTVHKLTHMSYTLLLSFRIMQRFFMMHIFKIVVYNIEKRVAYLLFTPLITSHMHSSLSFRNINNSS